MSASIEATVQRSGYVVSCIPEDNTNRHHFEISVEYRGRGLWGVFRHGFCLAVDGSWDYEPNPSSREDDWLETHRFDEATALELAKEAAKHITTNGFTVEDVLAKRRAGSKAYEL